MDQTVTATSPVVQWFSLGPSKSAKRSLFSFGRSRRPTPIICQEMTPPDQLLADDPSRHRHDGVRPGSRSQFNRSLSMLVRSSRSARKSYSSSSESSSQQTYTSVRLLMIFVQLLHGAIYVQMSYSLIHECWNFRSEKHSKRQNSVLPFSLDYIRANAALIPSA